MQTLSILLAVALLLATYGAETPVDSSEENLAENYFSSSADFEEVLVRSDRRDGVEKLKLKSAGSHQDLGLADEQRAEQGAKEKSKQKMIDKKCEKLSVKAEEKCSTRYIEKGKKLSRSCEAITKAVDRGLEYNSVQSDKDKKKKKGKAAGKDKTKFVDESVAAEKIKLTDKINYKGKGKTVRDASSNSEESVKDAGKGKGKEKLMRHEADSADAALKEEIMRGKGKGKSTKEPGQKTKHADKEKEKWVADGKGKGKLKATAQDKVKVHKVKRAFHENMDYFIKTSSDALKSALKTILPIQMITSFGKIPI